MRLSNRDLVLRALLGVLPAQLEPFTRRALRQARPAEVRRHLDDLTAGRPGPVDLADLSTQLRLLTARGSDNPLLDLDPGLRSKLHEVRHFRNDAVHGRAFDADLTLAALVAVSETLRLIAAPAAAREEIWDLIKVAQGNLGGAASLLAALHVEAACQPVLCYGHAVAGLPLTVRLRLSWKAGTQQFGAVPGIVQGHAPGQDAVPGQFVTSNPALSAPFSSRARPHLGKVEVRLSVIEHDGAREVTEPHVLHWDTTRPVLDTSVALKLERASLRQVVRDGSAELRVELTAADGSKQVRQLQVLSALAPRQWRLQGSRNWAGAALATLVQPGQGLVECLAQEALHNSQVSTLPAEAPPAERGAQITGKPAGAVQVDALVAAVCAALRRRRLSVLPTPGTWETVAHPVRTGAEVIDSGSGTALDLAVLVAAVLERLQVDTALLLTGDSVCVGYRCGVSGELPTAAQAQHPDISGRVSQLVAEGRMGLVDPQLAASGPIAVLHQFSAPARQLAMRTLEDLVLAVPLEAARSQGAAPQPQLVRQDDDLVVEQTWEPLSPPVTEAGTLPAAPAPPPAPAAAVPEVTATPDEAITPSPTYAPATPGARAAAEGAAAVNPLAPRVPAVVEEWKHSLLDLTRRNPLIHRGPGSAVELLVPPTLLGQLEDLVNRRDALVLRAQDDATGAPDGADIASLAEELLVKHRTVPVGLSGSEYSRRMPSLAALARTTLEETGANNLYLALGTLVWWTDGHLLRSPLVLVPVTLDRDGDTFGIILDQAGASTPNYSLVARFQADTGINLTELREPVQDQHGVDVEATLQAVQARLKRERARARVEETAHLGMFRFSTYRMWQDLADHWPILAANPLVSHLAAAGDADAARAVAAQGPARPTPVNPASSTRPQLDLDQVVENLPLEADSSQAQAVAEAVSGQNLVIEGPPGTGKSQTVANLIFRALGEGRTVMFVAEKASALDVVARRLREEVGIGDLLLNLHDNGVGPVAVGDALRRALDREAPTTPETDPAALREQLAQLRSRLRTYQQNLHQPGPRGMSYYAARQHLLAAGAEQQATAQAAFDERARTTGLNAFDPAAHTQLLEEYRRARTTLRAALPDELLATVLRRRDAVLAAAGERAKELREEIHRRKPALSVRDLLDRYGDLVTAITPCVLVSPDSVARFFPADRVHVDVVVFDEASQITVPGAIGAIGRGRSTVVVGDPRQMPPPTMGLGVPHSGSLDSATPGGTTSILDLCLAEGVTHRRLTWHYRSRVESLIAFSNRRYYKGELLTFPSPLALAEHPDDGPGGHGVSLRRVAGTYYSAQEVTGHSRRRGLLPNTNPVEAHQVVQEVLRRFQASPEQVPSLGVITLNARQRDLIENQLRSQGSERLIQALDARDGLLVRNLDNVQGEERDTILLSLTVSANSCGDVPLNFGSLSHEGGERRLNVAISRARRQLVIFSSFDPAALHAERSVHQGIKHLRAYLEAVSAGRLPRAVPRAQAEVDLSRADIAERLREAGLDVSVGVGHSTFEIDLVLTPPGVVSAPEVIGHGARAGAQRGPLTAGVVVLLDGPGWDRRRSVADRDLLPVEVLRSMGWPQVERLWLPQWVADPEGVVAHLVQVTTGRTCATAPVAARTVAEGSAEGRPAEGDQSNLPRQADQLGARQAGTTVPEVAAGAVVAKSNTAAAGSLEDTGYRSWQPEGVHPREVLDRAGTDPQAHDQLVEVARAICDVEAPLTMHRLVVKLCRAHGLSRTTTSREAAVRKALGESFAYVDEFQFVWRTYDSWLLPVSFRRNALDHVDSIEEIHPRELTALMAQVRERSPEWSSAEELCERGLRLLSARRRQLSARGVLPALTEALKQAEAADTP
ncbi:DUF3320 domain-containing protein [Actinomyces trachealis]|uniref:DUF3320 domain-containing protein n=1 Tax=Actinomyces trachealis TaxID=2763540 RepID=UPI001FD1F460|nr:DUF3320 domain-containing protein [Actinomyces trachealis]